MVNPASILRHFVSRTNLPQNPRQRDQRQNKQQWRQRITLELQSQHKDNKPWWKRRLEGQINELRKDLIRIEQMDRGAMKYSDMRNRFMKKYQVKGKGMSVVKEEIKQRVKAKAAKAKRYDDRVRQFHQNRLFNTNQRQLFKELDGKCDNSQVGLELAEARTFWVAFGISPR